MAVNDPVPTKQELINEISTMSLTEEDRQRIKDLLNDIKDVSNAGTPAG